jgi:hypothetical protein
MGRKARFKRERKRNGGPIGAMSADAQELHVFFPVPGDMELPPEFNRLLTANFQKNIHNSPLWNQMVAKFGKDEAGRLLKQFKAETR